MESGPYLEVEIKIPKSVREVINDLKDPNGAGGALYWLSLGLFCMLSPFLIVLMVNKS